jgi:hypothetical protein
MGLAVQRDMEIYGNQDLRQLLIAPDREFCGARNAIGYECTRPKGHPEWWSHVAANIDYVIRVWDGTAPPQPQGWLDPEDGTPTDDPAILDKAGILLGYTYRLRDRENKLYVTGGVGEYLRADGLIEVLDLKKREFRILPVEEIVPTDYVMSLDELSWIGKYVADVRATVKAEAVAMFHLNKWCKDGMDAALRDIGMSKYVPELRGDLVLRIPWSAGEGTVRSTVATEFQDKLKGLDLSGFKLAAGDDEIELDTRRMTIATENVGRR